MDEFKDKAKHIFERQGLRSIAQRMSAERGLTGEAAAQFERRVFSDCVEGLAMDLQDEADREASAATKRILEA